MKRLLTTTALAIAVLHFSPAHAAFTVSFCGPQTEGGTCELPGPDFKVYGETADNVMNGYGNIGTQTGTPIMKFHSDGGMLSVTIDVSNGFATIKPGNNISFNGLDITIPGDTQHPFGYGFTQIAFDSQLTPTSSPTDHFTITDYTGTGAGRTQVGSNTESDAPDTDKEFSTTATGGTFSEVNIDSLTGFDQIKHIEVGGVCAFTDATDTTCTPVVIQTPEPAGLLVLGTGLLGLGMLRRRR